MNPLNTFFIRHPDNQKTYGTLAFYEQKQLGSRMNILRKEQVCLRGLELLSISHEFFSFHSQFELVRVSGERRTQNSPFLEVSAWDLCCQWQEGTDVTLSGPPL